MVIKNGSINVVYLEHCLVVETCPFTGKSSQEAEETHFDIMRERRENNVWHASFHASRYIWENAVSGHCDTAGLRTNSLHRELV